MFERTFALREYAPAEPFAAGGFSVTAIRVPHYEVEAYALRVSDGAHTLAYSGDSAPSDALVATARDADLFLCEATLSDGDLDGEPRGHLSLDEALEAHTAAGAIRLVVTHRPVELPAGAGIELAYDGLVLEI